MAMVVMMMMRVSGRMLQISNWELQGVSIPVIKMLSSTKALLTMTNRMKVHFMLKNIICHCKIHMMDRMRMRIMLIARAM